MSTNTSRSTMSSAFTRIEGGVRLDIFNAWQAGAFVGDIVGKPAKWAVYETDAGDARSIQEVAEKDEPVFLSLRKSEAIDWLITRQEALATLEVPAENAEVGDTKTI